ncbi:hypothetical protein L3Q82_015227 [Scortum barcoo]|uniref:Uncharacterized protein n=1 Tax=Scortum barcoo TaxID=214431 RepID=A0ACB8VT13_9TELE|nr:hypothetical protein L3Q82_015227 [Scortum barcoo]
MGSEKDSESPHSSVSGNPKCRAGKRQGRISFHSLFHSKRGSRGTRGPKGGAATPLSHHLHTQQQLLPSALSSVPAAASATPTTTTTTAATTPHPPGCCLQHPFKATLLQPAVPGWSPLIGGGQPPGVPPVPGAPARRPASSPSCWGAATAPASAACDSTSALKSQRAESSSAAPSVPRDWPRNRWQTSWMMQPCWRSMRSSCCGGASPPIQTADGARRPTADIQQTIFAVIASGCASCPRLVCRREGCGAEFCYHCKQAWHPNQTCDSARQQRAQSLHTHSNHSPSYTQEQGPADDIKPCPRCGAYIIKMNDGSCNHMTCAVCGCEFCWLCMKEISDLHYLSPSGCTFWGKKPWSRKKKILWQLGTLIGAPVGITLIAGIAVPAMVIGIPVYVGRKIHAHYELKKSSRHRRNLAITGGVALSIVTAPVIAAVSVGIGVPIMLAYVYGVVPISLCRGGGCGVSRGKGRGVRIDFDEDDGPITVADAWRALKSPSLGESSLDGAVSGLSTTSPSEGLSVAPGTLGDTPHFNTLAGGALGTRTGKYSRLEVQAGELAKESAQRETGSLGAGSDCASTRGMAGSIISSYTLPDRECTNLEIQVDIETKPSHLCLTSEEDLTPPPGSAAMATVSGGEEPQDCSSRRGGALSGSALGLSPGASIREGLRDVTLAQPESIRSDLEMSGHSIRRHRGADVGRL